MVRPPRGSSRSSKYVVDEALTTTGTTKSDFILAVGTDNDSLGQTAGTDTAVPTGAKIKQFNIMTCYGSITGVSTFLHWSIQKILTGQSTISPRSVGGSANRSQVMMQGMQCIGQFQNATVDIKYKVPKSMWRLKDGEKWTFTSINSTNVDTVKQVIYTVFL